MANYDNTKFYWLQLKEDFFDDDAIQWIEEQPNGEKYAYRIGLLKPRGKAKKGGEE